jgi:hypothetical protein
LLKNLASHSGKYYVQRKLKAAVENKATASSQPHFFYIPNCFQQRIVFKKEASSFKVFETPI